MSKTEDSKELESLAVALGQGKEMDYFLDGKVRKAFPVTLAHYAEFVGYMQFVSIDNVAVTFYNDGGESLKSMLGMVFAEDDADEILENLTPDKYSNLIHDIYELQGIKLDNNNNTGDEKKR